MIDVSLSSAEQSRNLELQEWIQQIQKKDMRALENLYEATKEAIYGFSLALLRHERDAQDVMQETFVRIYEGASTYKPLGKPMAWIFTIARNIALQKIRQKKKHSSLPENFEEIIGTHGLEAQERFALEALLYGLKEDERQIVVLYLVSELKHKEIAELLGIPLSTVLSKYRRSLEKIKERQKRGIV